MPSRGRWASRAPSACAAPSCGSTGIRPRRCAGSPGNFHFDSEAFRRYGRAKLTEREGLVRREFLKAMGGLALAAGTGAAFGQARKTARVAYLYIFKEGPSAPHVSSFRSRMSQLGWVEGQNFVLEVRDAEGDFQKLDSL